MSDKNSNRRKLELNETIEKFRVRPVEMLAGHVQSVLSRHEFLSWRWRPENLQR